MTLARKLLFWAVVLSGCGALSAGGFAPDQHPPSHAKEKAPAPVAAVRTAPPRYVVEPPDVIVVNVLEALPGRPITGERLVRPDGTISLAHYGDLHVAGSTLPEIKEKVVRHLRQYINDKTLGLVGEDGAGNPVSIEPRDSDRVFVDVSAYNSKVYYVQGDVLVPSRLPHTGKETVLDAIQYAGGLAPTAARDRVTLVRTKPGAREPEVLPIAIDDVLLGTDDSTNYPLQPGDKLVVPRDPNIKAVSGDAALKALEARLAGVERKLDRLIQELTKLQSRTEAEKPSPRSMDQ